MINRSLNKTVAIVGSGPAALMAADVVSKGGHSVSVFEKRKGPGRKLLIAGSSGLNITNSLPLPEFIKHYSGGSVDLWKRILTDFSPQDWIGFIHELGINTFEGTSGRYFVEDMKASKLLRSWLNRLTERKVNVSFDHEAEDFYTSEQDGKGPLTLCLTRSGGERPKSRLSFDAICFCMGGGSYEPTENPLRWPSFIKNKKIDFVEFTPSNVGHQVRWSEAFLKEADGLPLKNVEVVSSKGTRKGDLVITQYGMEGTPIYFSGEIGTVKIDLKPDLSMEQILAKCRAVKENLSPIRRVSKQLNLCPAALALLFHVAPKSALKDMQLLAKIIKEFPITFHGTQSLSESISSKGGLDLCDVNDHFMLKKYAGVFVAGEMLNWDAPTGGFLIQACVSQGHAAGKGILEYLDANSPF